MDLFPKCYEQPTSCKMLNKAHCMNVEKLFLTPDHSAIKHSNCNGCQLNDAFLRLHFCAVLITPYLHLNKNIYIISMTINLKRVYMDTINLPCVGLFRLCYHWTSFSGLFCFCFFENQIEPKNAWLIVNTIHNHDLLSKLRIK